MLTGCSLLYATLVRVMKVVYINYLYDIRESSVGAAVHVESLAGGLRRLGHDVKTCYLNPYVGTVSSGKTSLRSSLKDKLSRYLNQINTLISNLYYLKKEYEIIKREKPDVIIARYSLFIMSAALIAAWKKIPYILEVNAPIAYESRRFASSVFDLPLIPEVSEKMHLNLADRIFVVSNPLKDYYRSWKIPPSKMTVVHNGVDIDRFQSVTNSDTGSRFDSTGPVIGFVGSFHYWHGISELAQVMESILERYDKANFLLIGDGPMVPKLKEQFREAGHKERIKFTGHIEHDQIPAYISKMDIALVLYPKLDFFYFSPLKIFEYMAAAKPILATGQGQILDIIQDGRNGFIFEPGNMKECLDKLESLIVDNQLRSSMGEAALETMKTSYTWLHAAKKVEGIMENAVTEVRAGNAK